MASAGSKKPLPFPSSAWKYSVHRAWKSAIITTRENERNNKQVGEGENERDNKERKLYSNLMRKVMYIFGQERARLPSIEDKVLQHSH